jgi:hypothetical protein
MKKTFAGSTFLILVFAAAVAAQDFHNSYTIRGGGQISVSNISGTIQVTGYGGSTIDVKTYRSGRDKDRVKVEDNSVGDRIELRAWYPKDCNCDASINFEVLVPNQVTYSQSFHSVSGDIEILGVHGNVKTAAVSGNVTAKGIAGTVSASSVSGDVDAEISALEGTEDMKFNSVSGSVRVVAPAALSAKIEMSSLSGTLDTNFPILVQTEKHGAGRKANGQLGNGTNKLKITTVSGNVALVKGS